jgi:cytoskeleton protein RodZ
MTEASAGPTPPPLDGRSAGQMLRDARISRGLETAALAAQLRVPPGRLDALEADRIDDLHGAGYSRSLALAVCRALQIEAEPVLARLPQPDASALGEVGAGLNAPFKADRGGTTGASTWLQRPALLAPVLVLAAAALLWWWPRGPVMPVRTTVTTAPVATEAASAASGQAGATGSLASSGATGVVGGSETPAAGATLPPVQPSIETVHSAPAEAAASASISGRPLQLRASAESWIEVLDARGLVLLSRTLQPGEQVGLAGAMPMQIKIGNAAATSVQLRGQTVELAGYTRDNIARLEVR